jgi:hypothetical protein
MADRTDRARDLLETAKSEPGAVDLDVARELLTAEGNTTRNVTLKALAVTAVDDPGRVATMSDRIIEALDDPFPVARSTAAGALTVLARTHPGEVRPAVPKLIDQLDDQSPEFRFRVAGAVATVADAYPEAFADYGDELLDVLVHGPTVDTDVDAVQGLDEPVGGPSQRRDGIEQQLEQQEQRSQSTREIAASVLIDVAAHEPDDLAGRLSDVESLTTDSSPIVRGAMLEVLAEIAAADPDAVDPVLDAVLERLDDDAPFVRASAIEALRAAGDAAAVEPLREVAESDSDEEIAELAAEAADELADAVGCAIFASRLTDRARPRDRGWRGAPRRRRRPPGDPRAGRSADRASRPVRRGNRDRRRGFRSPAGPSRGRTPVRRR